MVATTVTTAATVTTATATGSAVAFSAVAVVLLIVLLVSKELAGASEHPKALKLSKAVNIGAVPLLLTFAVVTVTKVMAVLG